MPAPAWRSWSSDGFQAGACRSRMPQIPAKEHNLEVEKQRKFIHTKPTNCLVGKEAVGRWLWMSSTKATLLCSFLRQKLEETQRRVNKLTRSRSCICLSLWLAAPSVGAPYTVMTDFLGVFILVELLVLWPLKAIGFLNQNGIVKALIAQGRKRSRVICIQMKRG